MKLSFDIDEGKELRDYAKELVKSQVKSVIRSELNTIISEEVKKFIDQRVNNSIAYYLDNQITTPVIQQAIERRVKSEVALIMEGVRYTINKRLFEVKE